MGNRWKIVAVQSEVALDRGTEGEPFAVVNIEDYPMILTKEIVWTEDDEPQSSTKQGG